MSPRGWSKLAIDTSMTIDISFVSMNIDTSGSPTPFDFARAIADPTRQRIMQLCCCGWCSVGEVVEALGGDVGQPTVSHHLAVLRDAGLVISRRKGRHVLYSLDQERVAYCCGRLIVDFAPQTGTAAALRARTDPDRLIEVEAVSKADPQEARPQTGDNDEAG